MGFFNSKAVTYVAPEVADEKRTADANEEPRLKG